MGKERRSLFKTIFGSKKQTQVTQTQLQMLNSYKAQFTTLREGTYESKVARECIDRIATHCAKLIPTHIQDSVSNHIEAEINFLLQNQPVLCRSPSFDYLIQE